MLSTDVLYLHAITLQDAEHQIILSDLKHWYCLSYLGETTQIKIQQTFFVIKNIQFRTSAGPTVSYLRYFFKLYTEQMRLK